MVYGDVAQLVVYGDVAQRLTCCDERFSNRVYRFAEARGEGSADAVLRRIYLPVHRRRAVNVLAVFCFDKVFFHLVWRQVPFRAGGAVSE